MSKYGSFQRGPPPAVNVIDFSGGTRGKFYRAGVTLGLRVYLETEVQTRLASLANAKGVDFSTLVNDMLRKDIELIEIAKS